MRHSAPGLSPAPAEEAGTPPLCPYVERHTALIVRQRRFVLKFKF